MNKDLMVVGSKTWNPRKEKEKCNGEDRIYTRINNVGPIYNFAL